MNSYTVFTLLFLYCHLPNNWHKGPYLSLPPLRQDLTKGLFYCGGLRRRRRRRRFSGMSRGSCPAGRMLVIGSFRAMWTRWADCWTWTHTIYYVSPAHMHAHSLNETREFSTMQCLSMTSSSTSKWPSRSCEPIRPQICPWTWESCWERNIYFFFGPELASTPGTPNENWTALIMVH